MCGAASPVQVDYGATSGFVEDANAAALPVVIMRAYPGKYGEVLFSGSSDFFLDEVLSGQCTHLLRMPTLPV